jgi:dihydrodipicolinate synthase/N-acetylneuraminate lyase
MEKSFPRGILATCVVPWNEKGELMEELFREEIRLDLRHTRHLYVMGTAGEGYAAGEGRYEKIVRVFCSEMKAAGAEPMVGIISLSLEEVHRRIEQAEAHGVHLFQISLPGWGPCTEKEIFLFFDEICGKHPECRFLHYNLLRSRVLVTPAQYALIAAAHTNLVATKNTTDSIATVASLILSTPRVLHFLSDIAFLYGCCVGECGMLISMASANWETAREYYELCIRRELPQAMSLQTDLARMVGDLRALVEPFSHMDGAFDKMFAKLQQPSFPLRLLPPYLGVPDEVYTRYKAMLKEKYPRWSPPS